MMNTENANDIVGYVFRDDTYCPLHIISVMNLSEFPGMWVEHRLDRRAFTLGIDRHDEASYDNGEFPKVVRRDMLQSGPICECGRFESWHDEGIAFGPCRSYRPTGAYETTDRCGSCGEVLGS